MGDAVTATPIYAELQQTLIDPETTDWGVSSPPAFAADLAEHAAQQTAAGEKATENAAESSEKKPQSTGQRGKRSSHASGDRKNGHTTDKEEQSDSSSPNDGSRRQNKDKNTETGSGTSSRSHNRRHRATE